jgi:hypothetical protein
MASQSLGTTFEPHRLFLVSDRVDPIPSERSDSYVAGDGLGCMRGLVFAMVFNCVLLLAGFVGWEVWRHLLR